MMGGIDAAAFANVFANNLIIIFLGAFVAYAGFNYFLPLRRKHAYAFWAYFLFKCALWGFYDAAFFFGLTDGIIRSSWAVIVPVMSIVTYAILYITWDSALLKTGLIGIIVDSVGGFCAVVMIALSSLLFTGEVVTDYVDYISARTFIVAIGQVVLFVMLIRLFGPVGAFIRDYKFKHERPWTIVLMTLLVFVASGKTQGLGVGGIYSEAFSMLALAVLLLVPHILWRAREARRRHALLARTRTLTRIYDDSLRDQASFLADSRLLLDGLSARITSAEQDAGSLQLAEHLERLRATCNELRFGTYSENPALDVTLVSWKARFDSLGIPVDYRISPLAERGAQASFVVQALFEWVLREFGEPECGSEKDGQSETAAMGRNPQPEEPRPKRRFLFANTPVKRRKRAGAARPVNIRLHVFRRANQLLVEMRVANWGKLSIPHEQVSERLPTSTCYINDYAEGTQKVIRAIVEEEPAWKPC